jgi:hypothetical protein
MIWDAEFNSANKSCMIRPRGEKVHIEAVSKHFPIYLGLGVYGHGTCLHCTRLCPPLGRDQNLATSGELTPASISYTLAETII